MRITIELSESSILSALNRVLLAKDNLEAGVTETLSELSKEGAIEANSAYGGMATATDHLDSQTTASIKVSGNDDDTVIIAEFGAGYATMEYHPLAAAAPVPIEVGSYSEANGGLFWDTHQREPGKGYWEFGGQQYTRVEPRHGLLNARDFIMAEGVNRAKGVIVL